MSGTRPNRQGVAAETPTQEDHDITDSADDNGMDHFGHPLREDAEEHQQFFCRQVDFTNRQAGQVARNQKLLHDHSHQNKQECLGEKANQE